MTDHENERRFPIQRGPSVPWSVMAPHESMAQRNHSQTLERLAERGGLSPAEAWCVVSGIDLTQMILPNWKDFEAKWREFAERINLHVDELDRLCKENDVLRGLMPALGAPCVYCGEKDISKCARGFPGCPQADDLMIGQDETGKRLIAEHAAMRDTFHTLLEKASDHTVFNDEDQVPECTCCGVELHQDGTGHRENCLALAILGESKCLSDTAGFDYISKESVKPLVEAAVANHKWHEEHDDYGGYPESDLCELNCKAIAVAKSLGLPTEKEGT